MRSSTSRQAGFSLLELMIVVTIIGIISAIVMVALGASREGGRNAARVSQIKEVMKALEIFYSDSAEGRYPLYPVGSTNAIGSVVCLGDYSDDRCWNNGTGIFERAQFNSALSPTYLKRWPSGENERFGDNGAVWYEGMTYRHELSGKAYRIQYFMEGNDKSCDIAGATGTNVGPDTMCTLTYNPQ